MDTFRILDDIILPNMGIERTKRRVTHGTEREEKLFAEGSFTIGCVTGKGRLAILFYKQLLHKNTNHFKLSTSRNMALPNDEMNELREAFDNVSIIFFVKILKSFVKFNVSFVWLE